MTFQINLEQLTTHAVNAIIAANSVPINNEYFGVAVLSEKGNVFTQHGSFVGKSTYAPALRLGVIALTGNDNYTPPPCILCKAVAAAVEDDGKQIQAIAVACINAKSSLKINCDGCSQLIRDLGENFTISYS